MPTFRGWHRLSMAAVATAASMALPPCFRISSPAWAASGWLVVTIPCCAITSDRFCCAHPSERSPGTALQKGGVGVALQYCTGDWAKPLLEPKTTARRPIQAPLKKCLPFTSLNIETLPRGYISLSHLQWLFFRDFFSKSTTATIRTTDALGQTEASRGRRCESIRQS